jgi:hypothetical protein
MQYNVPYAPTSIVASGCLTWALLLYRQTSAT